MGLIKSLWRGDVPLAKTYWLFGVAVASAYKIINTYISLYISEFSSQTIGLIIILVTYCFGLVYTPFIWVAIFRSADKYQGPKGNALAAQFSVVFGVIIAITKILD